MESLQDFGYKVSYFTAGQARNTAGQEAKANMLGSYSNRQAGKCLAQTGFILPNNGLSVVQSVSIKGESVHRMHHLDFQL